MNGFGNFLPPALALFIILRRGMKPQRIKPNRLWLYPAVITLLAFAALWRGKAPGVTEIAIYAVAALAGGVVGWLGTRHVALTLDEKTGTIMSQPTMIGTAVTAAVFAARFGLDALSSGGRAAD